MTINKAIEINLAEEDRVKLVMDSRVELFNDEIAIPVYSSLLLGKFEFKITKKETTEPDDWEVIIGVEIHLQLTELKSKLFCSNSFRCKASMVLAQR